MEVCRLRGPQKERTTGFVVKLYHSFEELPPSYRSLFDDLAAVSFSTSLPWFRTFASTALQKGARLRLYGVESKGPEAVARGLLVAQSPAARRGSVLRNLRIGQRTLSGLAGYQTYLYAPLLRDDDPEFDEILHCLARHLRDERPRWEMIDFAAMDREARSFDGLVRALGTAGFVVRTYPHFLNVFERTTGQGYAAYIASRPPSAREQIKKYERKERQLRTRTTYRATLFTNEAGLNQALLDYATVLEASWKEADYHPGFMPACIRASAQANSLRLFLVYVNDQPAAVQLVFIAGKQAVFYRTAYDPAFATTAVGAIAKLNMVRHVLDEDRIEEMEFGRDREAFKKTWASGERIRCGIIAFDCATIGGWLGLAEQILFELREWLGRATRPLRARWQQKRGVLERSQRSHGPKQNK